MHICPTHRRLSVELANMLRNDSTTLLMVSAGDLHQQCRHLRNVGGVSQGGDPESSRQSTAFTTSFTESNAAGQVEKRTSRLAPPHTCNMQQCISKRLAVCGGCKR